MPYYLIGKNNSYVFSLIYKTKKINGNKLHKNCFMLDFTVAEVKK